jgi:hypothetical protein
MKELKRMIREGELDQERTLEHLKQEFETGSMLPPTAGGIPVKK